MNITYIELLGEKHPMCLSLAATQAIDEAFDGGLAQMQEEVLSASTGRQAQAIDTVLQILLKAGRTYISACGGDLPEPLPCRPADLIDVRDKTVISTVFAALSNDTEREVEVEGKNGEAARGQ